MLNVTGLHLNLPSSGAQPVAPLSFALQAGQLLWVRGENGAGKSTLLKTLLGLQAPLDGQICWQTQSPGVFYLAHDLGMPPQLTVLDYCHWHPAILSKPSLDACKQALAAVGLLSQAHQLTGQISRGQQQRLAMACAILSNTQLWLLDEPLTALDQQGRELILKCLEQHKTQGGAAIVVSHHPIPEVADEVLDVVG